MIFSLSLLFPLNIMFCVRSCVFLILFLQNKFVFKMVSLRGVVKINKCFMYFKLTFCKVGIFIVFVFVSLCAGWVLSKFKDQCVLYSKLYGFVHGSLDFPWPSVFKWLVLSFFIIRRVIFLIIFSLVFFTPLCSSV